jgi:tRNA(His) 5'-end guanylyltransferase
MNEFTNSVIAYHQNNQVIILLDDYNVHNKEQYFGGNVQDIVSNVASEFTYLFNVLCKDVYETYNIFDIGYQPALFKVKVFNLTKEEVNNYFIFRQNTEYKNAIQNKCIQQNIDIRQVTTETRIELLKKNDTPFEKESQVIRKGACIFRDIKRKFIIDTEIPLFLEDSDYINKHIFGLEL